MESTLGKNIKVTIFGGSHESEIGCRIEGFPKKAMDFDHEKLQRFLDLRAPGNSPFATGRKEADRFEIRDKAPLTGSLSDPSSEPWTIVIRNTDQRSEDYKQLVSVPRPGHADYTARVRYGSDLNMAGGGPFSARMTAPLCIAGGIALEYLESKGIRIGAHLLQVGSARDIPFDPVMPDIGSAKAALELNRKSLPALDPGAASAMADEILRVKNEQDSVGGIVEVAATGIPPGIGGAMYDGLESLLSPVYFGIPAVKGIEFGAGFAAAGMTGSANNDAFLLKAAADDLLKETAALLDEDQIKHSGRVATKTNSTDNIASDANMACRIATRTNNAGGILGGITTGMPFIARVAFKPTPSIARMQESVNLDTMEKENLSIKGRHDPCVAVRAVPIVIAATALGLLDAWMGQRL